jgi:hypothetical protein
MKSSQIYGYKKQASKKSMGKKLEENVHKSKMNLKKINKY